MPGVSTSNDVDLICELVRDAGRLAARMRQTGGLTVTHKSSVSDLVSAADTAAEALVVDRLRAVRPADGVIGEEGTLCPTDSGRTWHVDPVDGTYNFVAGLPLWCSAAALVDGDELLLGAVYQPAVDELWVGGVDHRTTCNGVTVPPVADAALDQISVVSYLHPTTVHDDALRHGWLAAISGAATVRMLGSGSIELAAIAAGRLGVWVQHDSLSWDWLPGAALVRAAGGSTGEIDVGGHRWRAGGPATAVAQVLSAIQRSWAG